MRAKNNHPIPDRMRPGSTTSALAAGSPQGGSASHQRAKNATGDRRNKEGKEQRLQKQEFTTGTWNVRTLSATGKLKELCHDMGRYTWNVLGLAEVRWPGTGKIQTDEGHKVWFMG